MYLPGTLVLLLGHEVQMLPRQLYLDRLPRGWTNGTVHQLEPGTNGPGLPAPSPHVAPATVIRPVRRRLS